MKTEQERPEESEGGILSQFMAKIPSHTKRAVSKKMALAVAIDDARQERGWSQKELAVRLGKKESEISRWLSGKQNFTLETICLIEDMLKIDLIAIGKANETETASPTAPMGRRGTVVRSMPSWMPQPNGSRISMNHQRLQTRHAHEVL